MVHRQLYVVEPVFVLSVTGWQAHPNRLTVTNQGRCFIVSLRLSRRTICVQVPG